MAPFVNELLVERYRPDDVVFNVQNLEELPAEFLAEENIDLFADEELDFVLSFDYDNVDITALVEYVNNTNSDYPLAEVVYERNHFHMNSHWMLFSYDSDGVWANLNICVDCYPAMRFDTFVIEKKCLADYLHSRLDPSVKYLVKSHRMFSDHKILDGEDVLDHIMNRDLYCDECTKQLYVWKNENDCHYCHVVRVLTFE